MLKLVKYAVIAVLTLASIYIVLALVTPPMKVEHRVEFDQTREVAWRVFFEDQRMDEWQEGFVGMEHLTGEYAQPGSTYRLDYEMDGQTFSMNEELVAVEPGKSMSMRLSSPFFEGDIDVVLEDLEGGRSAMTSTQEFRWTFLMRPLALLQGKGELERVNEENYGRLKAMIDAEPKASVEPETMEGVTEEAADAG